MNRHPRDTVLVCPCCGVRDLQEFQAVQIVSSDAFDDDGTEMVEAHHFKCTACTKIWPLRGATRDELDGEAFGWCIERRAPAERDTVRPPAFAGLA